MPFAGFPTGTLDNGLVRIDYLQRDALRLVHLSFKTGENLFAELPEAGWETPNGWFRLLGGHRLWAAPEDEHITYLPEPEEILEERLPDGVRLTQPLDERSGLQKSIEIHLAADEARFSLRHSLLNLGSSPRRVAAWSISQFKPGGMAALPQPADPADVGGYLPNRSLALWPYTRLNDPRLRWLERYLVVRTDPIPAPCKVGYCHPSGWGAYLHRGVLVRKQVQIQPGATYPDLNSALEIYVNQHFLELETLSPLADLQPGQGIVHDEHWNLQAVPDTADEQALAELLDQTWPE